MSKYQSWGQYPPSNPHSVFPIFWASDTVPFETSEKTFLPYAHGRSYGDSCLNNQNNLLDVSALHRFIAFDEQTGILRCEAGITFSEIQQLTIPKGWFLPVTPGTQFVSVGGAIANDVHGKNHHQAGTFGLHVKSFELLRSNGDHIICSQEHNPDFYGASIGGLGLTGLILWAEIQLKPVFGPWMRTQRLRFKNLDDFFRLSTEADQDYEYTVAWIDCFAKGPHLGRGIFIRGNHQRKDESIDSLFQLRETQRIPLNPPFGLINSRTLKWFNSFYYHTACSKDSSQDFEPYDRFFYPLDVIKNSNRLYGSEGFLQYQCVIPASVQKEGTETLLSHIQRSKQGSSLAVLKQFGTITSPGLLSFPRPGTTLALDFPFRGEKTLKLLSELDEIVANVGGAVYPAKDARMSSKHFKLYFPKWKEFCRFIDPKFSSSFWRRVMNDLEKVSGETTNAPDVSNQSILIQTTPSSSLAHSR